MTKRFAKAACACLLAPLLACCVMDRKGSADEEASRMQVIKPLEDNMMYGFLEDVHGRDSLRIATDVGDTVWVRLMGEDAMQGEAMLGSRMAVIQSRQSANVALKVINLSMLMGEWVEPNAMTEGSFCGMELSDGGVASSINSQTTEYEGWRLLNGKLLLVSSPLGLGLEEQMVDTFTITMLTRDSLRLENTASKFFYCRKDVLKMDASSGHTYVDEDDRGGEYDLFNPEGDAPAGEKTEDGLLY